MVDNATSSVGQACLLQAFGTDVVSCHIKSSTLGWRRLDDADSGWCTMLVGELLDVLLIQMVSWCIDRASVCLMVMGNAHSLVLDGLEDERNGHFVALHCLEDGGYVLYPAPDGLEASQIFVYDGTMFSSHPLGQEVL